ncbi:hypothetical protein ES705_37337 [subsurface metagenome]
MYNPQQQIFPYNSLLPWSIDNYGPLVIPSKETSILLNSLNIAKYKSTVIKLEGRNFDESEGNYYIDKTKTTTYNFTKDYYFLLSDNRHNSNDSRYLGFVPEDHIIGKACFVFTRSQEERTEKNKMEQDV